MLRLFPTLLFCFFAFQLHSQSRYQIPDSIAHSVKTGDRQTLHRQLTKSLSLPEEQVRAFYSWIAYNIQYDIQESMSHRKDPARQESEAVLKSGKAVCHGYAALFRDLCNYSEIPCYLVSGYTKVNDKFDNTGHTWNVVYINNTWYPVDITWGAGGINENGVYEKEFSDRYFIPAPSEFLKDHYPFDPMWQLVNHPVKLDAYKKVDWTYHETNAPRFNYNDTIAVWLKGGSLERNYTSAARMVRFNPGDPVMSEQLSMALFAKGNSEFEKGNNIMEVLFPEKQPATVPELTSVQKQHKIAQLDSTDAYYQNAANYYRQVTLRNASDKAVLKGNIEALNYNRNVVKNEKQRMTH